MKRPIIAFVLLLLLGLATANPVQAPFSQGAPSSAKAETLGWLGILLAFMIPLMMAMIVIAAAVYVAGQIFGAETRARASVWSQGLLVAVGISALVIVMLYVLMPFFTSGQGPQADVVTLINQVTQLAHDALVGLILLLLVLSAGVYVIGQLSGSETRSRAVVWSTSMLSGAIVAAVIYVLLFQILGQFRTTFFSGTAVSPYADVVITITFFVAFLILATYLLSRVFKVPEWDAYLNIELSNLMASFLLVVFIIGLFAVGNAMALVYTGGAFGTPSQAAINYLQTFVAQNVLRGLYDVYYIQGCTSVLSTFGKRIGEYVLTQTFKVFPGSDTFVSITNVLGFGLVSIYGSLSAQIALFHIIDGVMGTFFLPAGLILRFFPPTRDAGAFLISVAFGFQILYPTLFMINKEIYDGIGGTDYRAKDVAVLKQMMCGFMGYGTWGFLFNPDANPIFKLPGGQVVGNFLSKVVSESVIQGSQMSYFIPIMRYVAMFSLLALFMPALAMMITIAFINAMTKFIVAKV